ncbi:hypothetical protein ACFRFH_12160 [Leifsonia sp. NPDC056824]|uniref:hypothetical protein n=1 Tax=Leifsonia sp. NPDC056824 TaxID=3345953 RepID=UPI00369944A9
MGVNPGSIANQLPPQEDDLMRQLRDLVRQLREQASARTGQAMEIGAGGIVIDNGGSLTIEGGGSLNVGSGALNSGGSITAGTTISAGTTITAGTDLIADGNLSVAGNASVTGSVTAASVSSGDVASTGRVTSGGSPLTSLPSYGYTVTTSYRAAWINGDGQFGYSPSTRAVKKDLEAFPDSLADAALALTPYLGRYTWDEETDPLKVFLIAEDVQAAGFGPDVVPTDEAGAPEAINYSQFVVPLLALVKRQQSQIDALTQRLTNAGIA